MNGRMDDRTDGQADELARLSCPAQAAVIKIVLIDCLLKGGNVIYMFTKFMLCIGLLGEIGLY